MKFARLRQASGLLHDVATILHAWSHSPRQGYFKHFFDTGR